HLRCATIALHGATGRCRASRLPSHVEEDGLVLALHVYVEAIEAILLSLSDERTAPFRRNEGEHRTGGIRCRLVAEIDAGKGVQEQAAHEDDEVEVWRF